MLLSLLKQINWYDVACLILLFRIGYIVMFTDFVIESFKLCGVLSGLYFSLHYYGSLTSFLLKVLHLNENFSAFIHFMSFILLAGIGYLAFILLRKLFLHFFNIKPQETLNKWGGMTLGMVRGILILSLLTYALVIFPVSYLKHGIGSSLTGRYVIRVAPAAYRAIWNGLLSRFMVHEEINPLTSEVPESLQKKE